MALGMQQVSSAARQRQMASVSDWVSRTASFLVLPLGSCQHLSQRMADFLWQRPLANASPLHVCVCRPLIA